MSSSQQKVYENAPVNNIWSRGKLDLGCFSKLPKKRAEECPNVKITRDLESLVRRDSAWPPDICFRTFEEESPY